MTRNTDKSYIINGLSVKDELLRLAEKGNQAFTASLCPGIEHVLGVRIPDLRILAKQIACADWEAYLDTAGTYYMEERTLQGLVLGYVRVGNQVEPYLKRVSDFVHLINSWAVCDSFAFAGGKSFVEANMDRIWSFVKQWMRSSEEYEIRFGVVMALKYFVDEPHLDELFACFNAIHHDGYYVKMAVAWAVSVCFVKLPKRTWVYLKANELDDFTFNKSLQKIVESYRVDSEIKKKIKQMKGRKLE